MTQYLNVPSTLVNTNNVNMYTMHDATATYAQLITAGYLNDQVYLGANFSENDLITIKYLTGIDTFSMNIDDDGVITLANVNVIAVGSSFKSYVTVTAAGIAAAAHFPLFTPAAGSYKLNSIFVNKSANLSGGGGDRLLVITDGTTVYNNAGITAALLGTTVNTVFGGSGNPVASGVAQSTSFTNPLYAVSSGGTTDYTTGSVLLTLDLTRAS